MGAVKPRIGILAMGRDTFDVPFAEEILDKAWTTLSGLDIEMYGEKKLLFNAEDAKAAVATLKTHLLDLVLLLQVTFTDASMTVEVAQTLDAPLVMWSFPEPRSGGRLRLNSFCGINLASHALSRQNLSVSYVHGAPDSPKAVAKLLAIARAAAVKHRLTGQKIAVIGEHPVGFDACNFSDNDLTNILGISADCYDLIEFLDQVKALPDEIAEPLLAERKKLLVNLDELDAEPTLKTLKVFAALRQLAEDKSYAGIAVRCWPEFFTHYGAAACGALAMMNENYIPCGCEADVYGVVTSLVLQMISGETAFNTDLVDIDPDSDTCVFWHCGQAPVQMADPDQPIRGTIHSNRKLPLLNEFPLKPGRITLARFSQGHGRLRLILGGGDMQAAPLAFSGTAGVAKLDSPIETVLENLIREGLEHHTALVYGEHRPALRKLAQLLDLEVVCLTD